MRSIFRVSVDSWRVLPSPVGKRERAVSMANLIKAFTPMHEY